MRTASIISIAFLPLTSGFSLSRRTFMDAAIGAAVVVPAGVAWADEDLTMPTPEEQKAADDAVMQERLRRKAELQKKASSPRGFADSMKAEREKQAGMSSKSKEERRNAMCEELGRGC